MAASAASVSVWGSSRGNDDGDDGGDEPLVISKGDRISVYWTDMSEWFNGTYRCSRVEAADDGGSQRSSCILYDAQGPWATCTKSQLTYWHCLDEQWARVEDHEDTDN